MICSADRSIAEDVVRHILDAYEAEKIVFRWQQGDVALYDGDPFEYTSHCVGTVIEGEVVFEGRR